MEKQETPPTMAQLWQEFDNIKNRFGSDEHYSFLIEASNWANPAKGRLEWIERITTLRQQLLEGCKPWITWRDDGSINARISFVPSNADAATLRKCAAICEYGAWELEQREIESKAKK